MAKPDRRQEQPYVFGYFLSGEMRNQKEVKQSVKRLNLPFWCISYAIGNYLSPDGGQIFDAGPCEFLGWIENADCILTDSFHAMAFSVIFHKQFWVFKRHKDHEAGSMNARITDFLTSLGLEERLMEDGALLSAEKLAWKIDYARVDRLLEKQRAFSMAWLEQALAEERGAGVNLEQS